MGDVRSRLRRHPRLCVVAVELHVENPAVQGPVRRHRRHEPFSHPRRADRRVPRIRQWRRGDGAARGRTGPHDKGIQTLDRLARGAAGNHRLSGAAKGLAREKGGLKNMNQRTVAKDDHRENSAAYQHILYEVSDKIATITLHRPDRMNAWTPIMERDVRHAMETAAADDNVRVIVLTGSGRAFCAGADMEALKGLDPNDIRRAESVPPFDMNRRADCQTRYAYYPSIPKPVIGMLNGAAAGIGLVHALYCDLRFAADNAVFTTAFSRRGLIAEHGISWMLPRIVGHANALDLLMSARRVSSDEALRIGLVNRLYPPEQLREQTYAYARDLADFVSPSAIAVIKRQLYDVPFQTLAEATIDANREMAVALRGSDFREGVASFMEKRPPRFTGK